MRESPSRGAGAQHQWQIMFVRPDRRGANDRKRMVPEPLAAVYWLPESHESGICMHDNV